MQIPPFAYGIALLGVILALLAGFLWFANKVLRRRWGGAAPSASQMLADFREAYEDGEISDQEFQTIKQRLSPQIQAEGAGIAGGATGMADAATALRGTADTLALGLGVAKDRAAGASESDSEDASGGGDRSDDGDGSGEADSDATPPDSGDSIGGDR